MLGAPTTLAIRPFFSRFFPSSSTTANTSASTARGPAVTRPISAKKAVNSNDRSTSRAVSLELAHSFVRVSFGSCCTI
eukprot:4070463-Pleurochrysis_carterae.AAC.1